MIKKIFFSIILIAVCNEVSAFAACAMSQSNGGSTLVIVPTPIRSTILGALPRSPSAIRREAAEEAQEIYGNRVAYDSEIGITFQFTVSSGAVFNFPALNYSGSNSLEMFLLSSLGESVSKDPNPCNPSGNGNQVFSNFCYDATKDIYAINYLDEAEHEVLESAISQAQERNGEVWINLQKYNYQVQAIAEELASKSVEQAVEVTQECSFPMSKSNEYSDD